MGSRSSRETTSSSGSGQTRTRTLSTSSSAKSLLPARTIEPLEYYTKRRFHPVHLHDTFQETRYSIIRKLGYGSFSTVWLARDNRLDRYVALKIGQAESEPTGEIGIYERLASSKLVSHPGRAQYLPLLDHFRVAGPNGIHQALVYEPMGASVAEVKDTLFPDCPFPLWTAKSIMWQTLLGLDYMLENAIAHGDVQPRNLLFTLEDLGSRSVAELEQDKDIPLTPVSKAEIDGVKLPKYIVPADSLMPYLDISRPFTVKVSDLGGSFLTTNPPHTPAPPFSLRAPETLFERSVTAAQDMWSFGCLIFEFITGIALFDLCDISVFELIDDLHFVDMYNVLGFPSDEGLRDRQWPGWRKYFTASGERINHHLRSRDRDIDTNGAPVVLTLEELLDDLVGESFSADELETTKDLLRGLLEFDPAKRFRTKQAMRHKWFEGMRV
ncbi:kinase-like domain-containing protein [Aspergillus pseudodeflectus]|uniref:Kinase-like domain-containing protein n=1 Tax=Aspergillus pseudodeflectus TaxID=176178 RepID=A0ABR4KXI1_9EURO